jgi:hypothetical protein
MTGDRAAIMAIGPGAVSGDWNRAGLMGFASLYPSHRVVPVGRTAAYVGWVERRETHQSGRIPSQA